MDFDYSQEQDLLREGVSRFVRDAYGLEQRRQLAATPQGYSPEHWQQFAELGWLMLNLPESAGGLGMSFVETALVAEQLGRGPVLEPFIATTVLGARLLERAPDLSDLLRDEWLTAVGEGRLLLTLAHAEPGMDYSLTQVSTRARREASGYRLNGIKQVVVAGAAAGRLIVSAQVADEDGFSLFAVEPDAAGLSIESYALIDASRAADVVLTDVVVAQAAKLAGPRAAFEILDEALDRARVAYLADAIGSQSACLDLTSDYIKTRRQFGQPIGNFQALQHMMAEAFVDYQASRSMLYRALALLDAASEERRRAVSAAKVMIASAGCKTAAACIQMHGAYGFTDEYAISHHYRHQLVLEKLLGDVEFHAQRLALAYDVAV